MGVQSLWTLLEPCGRRVNIEALTNKKLAVGWHPFPTLLHMTSSARHVPKIGEDSDAFIFLLGREFEKGKDS
jgi:hypothetical protein